MERGQEDRRVRRTKKALEDALVEQMKMKSINKISVKDLTEMVDINRGTFYLHYRDVYDLLEQVEEKIIQDIGDISQIDVFNFSELTQESSFMKIANCLEYIKERRQIFEVLLSNKGDLQFLERFKTVYREKFLLNVMKKFEQDSPEFYEYVSIYMISGAIGIIQEWIKNGMQTSCTSLANIILNIITRSTPTL